PSIERQAVTSVSGNRPAGRSTRKSSTTVASLRRSTTSIPTMSPPAAPTAEATAPSTPGRSGAITRNRYATRPRVSQPEAAAPLMFGLQPRQDRQHAPMVVVGRREVELGEDGRDVLLHRPQRDHQDPGDGDVRPAFGHQGQHVA